MALDRVVLKETLAHYRAWNEAEFVDQVRNAGKKTPDEKWREYQALFAFGLMIKPDSSPAMQRQSAREWQVYLDRIQCFEARRQSHG